jgi:hypothetical protein
MMLTDIERKTLRILGNFSAIRRRTPTVDELCIKTGRTRKGILKVLATLERERYIEWSPDFPDEIWILEAWERTSLLPHRAHVGGGNHNLFMD